MAPRRNAIQSLPLRWQRRNQSTYQRSKTIQSTPSHWEKIKPSKKPHVIRRHVNFRDIAQPVPVPLPVPQRFMRPILPPGPFEQLPLDIFHYILPNLEPSDRLSLAATCKRLHKMDTVVGGWMNNHFDMVHAQSREYDKYNEEYCIEVVPVLAALSTHFSLPCSIRLRGKRSANRIHNAGILQRATIDHLLITMDKSDAIDSFSFIFAFTQFKKLTVKVTNAINDATVRLLSNLLKGQDNEIEVDIDYEWQHISHYAWNPCKQSFGGFREFIDCLPKMKKIRIDWKDKNNEIYKDCEFPLDDVNLYKIVTKTNECKFGVGKFSARCLLDVFEICLNCSHEDKAVHLITEDSVIKDLESIVKKYRSFHWKNNPTDIRLRRLGDKKGTSLIVDLTPLSITEFKKSRREDCSYRRVTIRRVP